MERSISSTALVYKDGEPDTDGLGADNPRSGDTEVPVKRSNSLPHYCHNVLMQYFQEPTQIPGSFAGDENADSHERSLPIVFETWQLARSM